jgi:hypothetical protein
MLRTQFLPTLASVIAIKAALDSFATSASPVGSATVSSSGPQQHWRWSASLINRARPMCDLFLVAEVTR